MLQAAEALDWKNNGLLATFGLRLNNEKESSNPRTTLEAFFDQAQLCAMAPWWGWGLIQPIGIAKADGKQDRPLHLRRAHPQAKYFDFAYCSPGMPWSLILRALPWSVVQSSMMEHGIAAVMTDMRCALVKFNRSFGGTASNGQGNGAHASGTPNGMALKRRERGRQSKPNRAIARRH